VEGETLGTLCKVSEETDGKSHNVIVMNVNQLWRDQCAKCVSVD